MIIDRAYVINLDSRLDRWNSTSDQLYRLKIPFERFPAIRPRRLNGFRTLGIHGCLLSHLAVAKKHLGQGSDLFVLEDDVVIDDSLPSLLKSLPETLSAIQWGILYLGGGRKVRAVGKINDNLIRVTRMTCTHAMIINKDTLPVYIRHLKYCLRVRKRPIDVYLGCLRCVKLAVVPFVVNQKRSLGSDTILDSRRWCLRRK